MQINSHSTSSLTASLIPQTKVIIYDSPVTTNLSKQEQHQKSLSNNQGNLPVKIVSAALDGINSASNMMEKNLLHNISIDNSSNFTLSNESSSSSPPSPSLTYSSEATINLVNLKPYNNFKV